MTKIRSSIALVVGCVWALGLGGAALAADMSMPLKAPPPPAPPPLDIHGFVEWDYETFLINPQGQALIDHGAGTVVAGLDWVLYKNKAGFINKITTGGGLAADVSNNFGSGASYWGSFQPSANGDLFDTVFFIDASVTFGQYWTLSDTFYNVYSNDVACNATGSCATGGGAGSGGASIGFGFMNFNELKIALNDSFTGWPITFNPYVSWDYEFKGQNSGQMPLCFPCAVNNGDFIIGMTPTVSGKLWGMPWLTVKAPTYVTVGPTSFWNGNPAAFGASSGGVGVFTTGLTFVAGLTWIPSNLGSWYAKAGFQYYDVINNALVNANAFSVGTTANWATKDIIVGFAGIGVGF